MYCKNCGKEINENAVVCIHCGVAVTKEHKVSEDYCESKTGRGVLFALLLGLIGLLIGVIIYPERTIARKTFMKGWLITFIISIALVVVAYVAVYFLILSVYII